MTLYQAVTVLGAATILALIALYVAYDRKNAKYLALREVMRLYLAKALHDRNDKVRIPAEQVRDMFEIDDVRAIAPWKAPFRMHRHPATQPRNRGKG